MYNIKIYQKYSDNFNSIFLGAVIIAIIAKSLKFLYYTFHMMASYEKINELKRSFMTSQYSALCKGGNISVEK